MSSWNGLVSGLILAVGIALFIPAFSEAGSNTELGTWTYATQTSLVIENIPIILAAGVMLILVAAMEAQLK